MALKPLTVVALNSSTFVPITCPAFGGPKTFVLQLDAAIACNISDTLAGTNVFTIPASQSLAFVCVPEVQEGSFILCYAKAASSTPNMQILQID